MSEYTYGTSVKVAAEFKTEAGVAFDPTTVTCIVMAPNRSESLYVYGTDVELVKDSTGNYHLWIAPAQVGRYGYRFEGTSTDALVAAERTFTIRGSIFINASP